MHGNKPPPLASNRLTLENDKKRAREAQTERALTAAAARGESKDSLPTPSQPPTTSSQPRQRFSVVPKPQTPAQIYDAAAPPPPGYGAGQTIKILHVAEKPSIGASVAKALVSRSNNYTEFKTIGTPVHEFESTAQSLPFHPCPHAASHHHTVTSVTGHVFNVDFPESFQSWDAVDPLELYGAPVTRKPCKSSIVKHLATVARNVDFIVLWMDCDREGENINFEVLDICLPVMNQGGAQAFARVFRAHFSAIMESDILKAYTALGKPDQHQSHAVDARQELDLKVGVSFSRFQTRFFQGRYGDLQASVLSYGPCQTPTLGFVVQRYLDIQTFKPEPFWALDLAVSGGGRLCRCVWDYGRSFNKSLAESLHRTALADDSGAAPNPNCPPTPPPIAVVSRVVTREKLQGRPTPMNTVAYLKACSKGLGIGPHQAMQVSHTHACVNKGGGGANKSPHTCM